MNCAGCSSSNRNRVSLINHSLSGNNRRLELTVSSRASQKVQMWKGESTGGDTDTRRCVEQCQTLRRLRRFSWTATLKRRLIDKCAKAKMNCWSSQVRREGECAKANHRSLVADADSNEQRRTPWLQNCLWQKPKLAYLLKRYYNDDSWVQVQWTRSCDRNQISWSWRQLQWC